MLTPEQKAVVDQWGSGMAVIAGAGSGKTYTLVQKVKALLQKKPDARFAAVSFTEKSAADLRAKLTQLTLELQGKPLQGHFVTTIHGLCSNILREYPREAGFDGDEQVLSESQAFNLWNRAVESIWFDDLPEDVEQALKFLSERESQSQLKEILTRVRDLLSMNVLNRINSRELSILSKYVLERYDRIKRRRGGLDFNDLERGADLALRHDAVSQDYRNRFDLVMVDEFQDTNPVQARILERFVKPDYSNLLVVGDPKQAIYGFRDADVSVFEDFCSRLPLQQLLSVNFRSLPEILEFSNDVCIPAFEASEMKYQALQAGKPESEQSQMRDSLKNAKPISQIEVQGPEQFAKWVKNQNLQDTALLLRKIRGNEKWLQALQSHGVPIAIESGGLLWSDPRARELAHLLKWWVNPGDEYAAVTVLRSPWVSIPDATIEAWKTMDATFLAPFFDSDHSVARAIRGHFLTPTLTRPGEVLLSLLHSPGVESELGVFILALWHRCEDLSTQGLDSQRVVEEIWKACTDERRDRTPPPPQNTGLRIMTVHGSKGLEFDHVFLLDFPEKPSKKGGYPLLYWDKHDGAYLAKRDEFGDRLKEGEDPEESLWQQKQSLKDLAESKRLLYVAITRAKKRIVCVLPTTLDIKKRESIDKARSKIDDIYKRDFWRAWVEPALNKRDSAIHFDFSQVNIDSSVIENTGKNSLRQTSNTFKPKRPRHGVSEWNRLSQCPRRYEWSVVRPKLSDEEFVTDFVESNFKNQKIPQSEVGTRLHRCLETGDFEELAKLETDAGKNVFSANAVMKWAQSSALMNLQSHYDDRCVDFRELTFEIPISDEVLVGAIDRLVVDKTNNENPKYTVIDFKVTGSSRSDQELVAVYETQLNLYVWALGVLEPSAKGNTRAVIVRIDPNGVKELSVPVKESQLDLFLNESQKIVQGATGAPRPGSSCKYCEFKSQCIEGRQYLGI